MIKSTHWLVAFFATFFFPFVIDLGFILRLSDFFLVLAIAHFLFKGRPQFRQMNQNNVLLSLGIFSLYTLVNILVHKNSIFNIAVEGTQLIYLLLFISLCNARTLSSGQASLIAYILLLVVFLAVLYHFSVGQFVYYKNVSEVKLLFGLAPLLCLFLMQGKGSKIGWIIIFFVFLVFLILSGERKAQFGFSVAGMYLLITSTRRPVFWSALLCLLIIGLSGLLVFSSEVEMLNSQLQVAMGFLLSALQNLDISDVDTASLRNRIFSLGVALEVISNNPLFGSGATSLATEITSLAHGVGGIRGHGVHNIYIQIAAASGLIGLTLFGFVLIYIGTRVHFFSLNNYPFMNIPAAIFVYAVTANAFLAGGMKNFVLFGLALLLVDSRLREYERRG